jgi:UDP-N-acetylbacillosamine transaminase
MSTRRIAINARYRDALSALPIRFMPVPAWSDWNGWMTCVVFDHPSTRDRVMGALEAQDIESRPLWKPLHMQPVFEEATSWVDGTSEALFHTGLCLPSGSGLDDDSIACVAEIIVASMT